MAGAKQAMGGEGRGRKAPKGKVEEVPFPLSLIPSPFSFLPLPFLSLRRRFEELLGMRAATFNAWSISNRQRYCNRPGKPSSTGTSCDPGMNRARGGS